MQAKHAKIASTPADDLADSKWVKLYANGFNLDISSISFVANQLCVY